MNIKPTTNSREYFKVVEDLVYTNEDKSFNIKSQLSNENSGAMLF